MLQSRGRRNLREAGGRKPAPGDRKQEQQHPKPHATLYRFPQITGLACTFKERKSWVEASSQKHYVHPKRPLKAKRSTGNQRVRSGRARPYSDIFRFIRTL